MKKIIKILIIAIPILSSCLADLDFNRANDLQPSPTLLIPIVHDTLRTNEFIDFTFSDTVKLGLSGEYNIDEFDYLDLKINIQNSYPFEINCELIFVDNAYNSKFEAIFNDLIGRICTEDSSNIFESRNIYFDKESLINVINSEFLIINISKNNSASCTTKYNDFVYVAIGIETKFNF